MTSAIPTVYRAHLGAGFDPVAGSRILSERIGVHTICSWCPAVIKPGSPDRVSHGICPACLARELAA